MSPNVQIEIRSWQKYPGEKESTEPIVERAVGRSRFAAGKLHILYDSESGAGEPKLRTHLIFDRNRMEVRRHGQIESAMVFECGLSSETDYITPYGRIPMKITTTFLKAEKTETAVKISLRYELFAGGGEAVFCRMEICVKK